MRTLGNTIVGAGIVGLVGLLAGCASMATLGPGSVASEKGPARLRQVSLFSNGVGAFEYEGVATGDAAQTLLFKGDQINDVLGTMVFQGGKGGRAGEITFPTETPMSTLLAGFRVNLNHAPSRFDILSQLRGVLITVRLRGAAAKKLTGRIVDLRAAQNYPSVPQLVVRANAVASRGASSGWVLNMLCGSTMEQVRAADVAAITIRDTAVRRSLTRALDALAGRPDRSVHPVTVWFHGHGRRQVGFAYLAETPVWRMTYRLVEPPTASSVFGAGSAMQWQPVKLQGMAIVANQSGSDWDNVRLNICGGDPISFIANLYQPLYKWRMVQPPPAAMYESPQTYYQGLQGNPGETVVSPGQSIQGVGNSGGGGGLFGGGGGAQRASGIGGVPLNQLQVTKALPTAHIAFNPTQGVAAIAAAGRWHPQFDYQVGNISVPRGESAMAPVLVASIQSQPVDYFYAFQGMTVGAWSSPLLALAVRNSTGKFLPNGPLAVYQGGMFAGQAKLPALAPEQRHVVRYGVDRAVRVKLAKQVTHHAVLVEAGVSPGRLELGFTRESLFIYAAVNAGAKSRALILQTDVPPNQLVVPSPKSLRNQRHPGCRFRLALAADGRAELHILQRVSYQQYEPIESLDRHAITALLKKYPDLPKPIAAALRRGQALLAVQARAAAAVAATQARLATASLLASRFEQSLAVLKKVSPAYNDLAAQLSHQNKVFTELSHQLNRQTTAQTAAAKALASYWAGLNIAAQPLH